MFILTAISITVTDNVMGGKYGDITPTNYEIELLEKINENRTDNGVVPLRLNASLTWVTRAHCQDMIDHDFFDHTSSQQGQFNGATFQERVLDYAEYENTYVGECIAWKSWGIDVEGTMSDWKNSPTHWNIIINPNFREIGIGLVIGEWDGWSNAGLHTVDFGGHSISVDLSVSDLDIGFDPTDPDEGQDVEISAVIKNTGSTDAFPVAVNFYDGDPQSGGTLIETKNIPQILVHGEETIASIIWDTTGKAGAHDIYVSVDPNDIIAENNEGNNIAFRALNVGMANPPIHLEYGWNLVSFPYAVSDTQIENVLISISGQYLGVQAYDPWDEDQKWKHFNTIKSPNANQLSDLDNSIGFWIRVIDPSGADLVISGDVPVGSQHVDLKAGWNIIGYSSTTSRLRDDALNNLVCGPDIEIIQWYDATTKTYEILESSDTMEHGRGYMIYANHDCTWIIDP
jgi:uncharacterized protein YkwD